MADDNPLLGMFSAADEPWSLEETQEKVLSELKKILASGKVDNKHLDKISKNVETLAKDNVKAANDVDKQLKAIKDVAKSEGDLTKTLVSAFKKETKDRRADQSKLRDTITDTAARQTLEGQGIFGKAREGLGKISGASGKLVRGLTSFGGSLKDIAAFAGGGLLGALTGVVVKQVDVYQRLTNVGQTFSGDLLNMSRQAAEAGLSLERFAELTTKYSRISANVGIKTVMDHQKAVRQDIMAFGNFGMTLQQVTDFSADHLEQLRISGQFDLMTANQRRQATVNYLKDLTELSKVTGKRREQIAEELKQQQESVDKFTARMAITTEEGRKAFDETFSVLQRGGQLFGKEMTENLLNAMNQAQVFGTTARNEYLKSIRTVSVEMSAAVEAFDRAAIAKDSTAMREAMIRMHDEMRRLKDTTGATVVGVRQFGGVQQENMKTFAGAVQNVSRLSTNAADVFTEVGKNAVATSEEQQTAGQKTTKTLLNLESQLSQMAGDMRKVLIDEFGPQMNKIVNGITDLVKENQDSLREAAGMLKTAIGGVSSVTDTVIDNFAIFGGALATAVIGLKAFGAVRGIGRLARGAGRAARGGRAASTLARAANAARTGAGAATAAGGAVAQSAGRSVAKKLGKGVLKSALKKIPFIGLFAGLGFAAGRAMDGDFAGAALEAMSGAASTLPGVGTAASVGLDAALMARDVAKEKSKLATPTPTEREQEARKSITESVPPPPPPPGIEHKTPEQLLMSIDARLNEANKQLDMLNSSSQSTARSAKKSEPNPFGTDVIA